MDDRLRVFLERVEHHAIHRLGVKTIALRIGEQDAWCEFLDG